MRVSQVKLRQQDIGTTTRVRLEVSHDGPSSVLPRLWFVKTPSRYWQARWICRLAGLLTTEARFYRELANRLPVASPKVLSAKASQLVLGDLDELGASPGQPAEALTYAQAQSVTEALGKMHRSASQHIAQNQSLRWLGGPRRKTEDRLGDLLAAPLMKRGLALAGESIPKALHEPAMMYARHRRKIMAALSCAPQTLIHHDCHGGNLFWLTDGSPGLLDWQLARLGDGVSDLAYLLATALEPTDQRQWLNDLLATYTAASGVDHTEVKNRLGLHCCYAFEAMVVTLALGSMMPKDVNHALIRRAAGAVEQFQGFSALSQMLSQSKTVNA